MLENTRRLVKNIPCQKQGMLNKSRHQTGQSDCCQHQLLDSPVVEDSNIGINYENQLY